MPVQGGASGGGDIIIELTGNLQLATNAKISVDGLDSPLFSGAGAGGDISIDCAQVVSVLFCFFLNHIILWIFSYLM